MGYWELNSSWLLVRQALYLCTISPAPGLHFFFFFGFHACAHVAALQIVHHTLLLHQESQIARTLLSACSKQHQGSDLPHTCCLPLTHPTSTFPFFCFWKVEYFFVQKEFMLDKITLILFSSLEDKLCCVYWFWPVLITWWLILCFDN